MKVVSPALDAIMNRRSFLMAELYTFSLVGDGSVLRYGDYPAGSTTLVANGSPYPTSGLKFKRGATHQTTGLEVDTLSLDVYADPDDPSSKIEGLSFAAFAQIGGFDGATVRIDKCFMSEWGDCATNGTMMWFEGRTSDINFGRTTVTMQVHAFTELLNQQMPRDVYQPGCVNTLYQPTTCKALKSVFASGGVAQSGCTRSMIIFGPGGPPDGYFTLGSILFTSGANAGISRSITEHTSSSGVLRVPRPFPAAPAPGDTFTAYPGCDKAMATCRDKFHNLKNFRGWPFVPVPETAR